MFVAVRPDRVTGERLARLDLPPTAGLRLVPPEQWHVTLRFLGDVDARRVPLVVDALGSLARSSTGPVRCVVGPRTAWFPGGRVLQVPVGGLEATAEAVRSATVDVVPDGPGRKPPFVGHLTLARTGRSGCGPAEAAALAGIPVSSTFSAHALHLVGSERTAHGVRYTTLWTGTLTRPPRPDRPDRSEADVRRG